MIRHRRPRRCVETKAVNRRVRCDPHHRNGTTHTQWEEEFPGPTSGRPQLKVDIDQRRDLRPEIFC